jgi:hypothetical protein
MPKKPATSPAISKVVQRQLERHVTVRASVQAALAVLLVQECKAWNVKTCRSCQRERTVAIHYAAKVYRTHDQVWLPSDVEATCVDCKAASIAQRWASECKDLASEEHRSRCDLLVSWLPKAEERDSSVGQKLAGQLLAQRGQCCYCEQLIHNLRVTNDPRRFLSIPQRVRYGVELEPVEDVGLQFDEAQMLVRLCHRKCVDDTKITSCWQWVDPPAGNLRSDQQGRLQELMHQVQDAYKAWLPSQAASFEGQSREQCILDVHRGIQRYYLLLQAGTEVAKQWNAWIRSDRAFARAAKAEICGPAEDKEERRSDEGEDEAEEPTPKPEHTEPDEALWRRLCNGARARSRRRGCGHLETLTGADLARCWEEQQGRCAKCTLTVRPISTVSVNRICTLQMNNIYGNGNCNLMHAECNVADAPNNLEEWLNGLLVHYRFVQAAESTQGHLPPELILQRDELRTKWERKHAALLRNATRVKSTLHFARATGPRVPHPQYATLAESIYGQHDPQSPSITSLIVAEPSVTKSSGSPSSLPSSSSSTSSSSAKLPSSSTCAACTDKSNSSE